QPVGNFGWVLAEVFEQAYEPMVAALERHPTVRLSLHYTGPLLEWLRRERPEFIDRVAALAARDQVEILGGGYYEPVLASLPERDRIGQLRRMGDELEALFGRRPLGAWLAERVWEPDLPTSLVAGGYDWTILDDAHFRAASIPAEAHWGPYSTDDQGQLIRVFGTEQGLRYRIPFREVDEVIDYLREHATEAGERIGMMGDDGEKFGAWPTTWEHCWGKRRWVDRFFEALEANADWLTTTTPSAWLTEHLPIGRVYIPTGSYEEMGEWALPADESLEFTALLKEAKEEKRPEARWLRGAFWRNFQVKYREINDLHKQMLRVSDAVEAMADGPDKERALDHLYQGQSNDCYWHGLFGGVYIGHMRLATYHHLIAAEDLADSAAGRLDAADIVDLDLDGQGDVRLAGPGQVVAMDLTEGAGIGGWDVRAARHALTAVMRRRPEAYHQTLRDHEAAAAHDTGGGEGGSDAPASIHEIVTAKEADLSRRIHYDSYERRSGLVRFLAPGTSADEWATGRAVELGDALDGSYELTELAAGRLVVTRRATVRSARAGGSRGSSRANAAVDVTKTVVIGGSRLEPSLVLSVIIVNEGRHAIDATLGLEWTIMLLGGGGNPAAWIEVDGVRGSHDGSGAAGSTSSFAQGNDAVGLSIETALSEPASLWWAPVETVSNSEGGFERVYQGAGFLASWPLSLAPGAARTVTMRHAVTATRDYADEERADADATTAGVS
ncbi:MAG TPA: alpha-amylase/4-alpha-glucanotransferase domain-containing protein, partial [Candidatus Limnocylindrales bacterium]